MSTYTERAKRVRDAVNRVASDYDLATDLVIDHFRGQDCPRTFSLFRDKASNFFPDEFSPCVILVPTCNIGYGENTRHPQFLFFNTMDLDANHVP